MSQNAINIIFKLEGDADSFKKLSIDADGFKKAVKEAVVEAKKLNGKVIDFAAVATGIDSANKALNALQGVIKDLNDACAAQVQVETQLEVAMRNTMHASDDQIRSVKELCSAQQDLGVIGDEVQLAGAAKLAAFAKEKNSLDRLIPAMNDMAAAQYGLNVTQENAVAVASSLGKAMDGQTGAMKRNGYTFTEAQEEVLKYGSEAQKVAVICEVVRGKAGGMNAELAKSPAGALKQTENTLGDIKELMGSLTQVVSPWISWGVSAISFTANLIKMREAYIAANASIYAFNLKQKSFAALVAVSSGSLKKYAAAMRLYSIAARSGTAATISLKLAIRGLMIATAAGAAIAALCWAFEKLMGLMDDTTDSAKETTGSVDDLADSMRDYRMQVSDVSQKASEYANKEMSRLRKLYSATQDTTKSMRERMKAVEELQRTYPSAFGNLDKEAILAGKAADAYNDLAANIIKAARAKAAEDKIAENSKAQLELDLQNMADQKALEENGKREAILLAERGKKEAQRQSESRRYSRKNSLSFTTSRSTDAVSSKTRKDIDVINGQLQVLEQEGEAIQTRMEEYDRKSMILEDEKEKLKDFLKSAPVIPGVTFGDTTTVPSTSGKDNGYQGYGLIEKPQMPKLPALYDPKATEGFDRARFWRPDESMDKLAEAMQYWQNMLSAATDDTQRYVAQLQMYKIGKAQDAHTDKDAQMRTVIKAKDLMGGDTAKMLTGMDETELIALREELRSALDLGGLLPDQIALLNEMADTLDKVGQKSVSAGEVAAEAFGATASSLRSLGSVMNDSAKAWLDYAAGGLQAIQRLIPAIRSVMKAKQAEAMAGAIAGSQTLPPPLNWINLGASVAAVIAAFASIPKFADGGVISGPTLGLMGEYAGASNNPEVVAPLDTLRDMLQPAAVPMEGKVVFELEGRKLVGVIEKEQRYRNRTI